MGAAGNYRNSQNEIGESPVSSVSGPVGVFIPSSVKLIIEEVRKPFPLIVIGLPAEAVTGLMDILGLME